MKEKEQPYDLIGDIHGQHGKLSVLLDHLGYQKHGESRRHPHGRKVIFLGDYVDRGPAVRETLHTVRGMVESGDALAIMGNHEYNAICAATPDGNGGFLRVEKRASAGHLQTQQQFAEHQTEWSEWLEWMKRLPMFLDLGGLRAVHACWDAKRIPRLQGRSLADKDFLHLTATHKTPEFRAVTNVLKGPELSMPPGYQAVDKEGIRRNTVRVRWWNVPKAAQIARLAMPEPFDSPGDASKQDLLRLPSYGADEPPVFFGHYWMPPQREREPLAPNIACLDYSAAFADNALTAYRWDGERVLSPAKFITAPAAPR